MAMTSLTLHVSGMSCGHCLNAVRQALESVPGVHLQSVRIGRADLAFDESLASRDVIVAAVTNAGYSATAA
jgi:copper chaperone